MLVLSQRDPRWAGKKLGKSDCLMKDYGCTTTCISMSTSYFACYRDPGYMSKYLEYTPSGLILWSSLGKVLGCEFVWRGYPSNFKQEEIDEALTNPNKTILLNVDGGKHWVLGIKRIPLTKKYWVADPWDGTRKFYSGVVGYSILRKK